MKDCIQEDYISHYKVKGFYGDERDVMMEILPCSKCAGKAKLTYSKYSDYLFYFDVTCTHCGYTRSEFIRPEYAIKDWNDVWLFEGYRIALREFEVQRTRFKYMCPCCHETESHKYHCCIGMLIKQDNLHIQE